MDDDNMGKKSLLHTLFGMVLLSFLSIKSLPFYLRVWLDGQNESF